MSGNTVYTTNYQTTAPWTVRYLKTWNVTTPTSPVLQNTYTIPPSTFKPGNIYLSANTAYVADLNNNAFAIIDVTNPVSPNYLSSINTSFGNVISGCISVVNNFAYIFNGSAIEYFDVTNKSNPQHITTIQTEPAGSSFGGGIALNGYLYIADYGPAGGASGNLDIYAAGWDTPVFGSVTASTAYLNTISASSILSGGTNINNIFTQKANTLLQKNGTVSGSTFSGSPLIYSVLFTTPFPNNNYAVTVTADVNRFFTVQSKSASGFTINANSATLFTNNNVFWMAGQLGETA